MKQSYFKVLFTLIVTNTINISNATITILSRHFVNLAMLRQTLISEQEKERERERERQDLGNTDKTDRINPPWPLSKRFYEIFHHRFVHDNKYGRKYGVNLSEHYSIILQALIFLCHCNNHNPILVRGPGSSVGTATGYRLDGSGIEFRWGETFRTCPDRP